MTTQIAIERPADKHFDSTVTVMGFGRRLLPALYDGLIIGVIGMTVLLGAGLLSMMFGWIEDTEALGFQAFAFTCGLLVSFIYYAASWTGSGQTAGMTLGGIKVVSTTGARPTFGQAVLRYIGYFVSAIPFALGFLWVAFDNRRQGWHDKLGRTYVVDSEAEFSDEQPPELVPSDPGRSWIWLASWLFVVVFLPGGLLASFWLAGPIVVRLVAEALGVGD